MKTMMMRCLKYIMITIINSALDPIIITKKTKRWELLKKTKMKRIENLIALIRVIILVKNSTIEMKIKKNKTCMTKE
jgi:hypothetical protein